MQGFNGKVCFSPKRGNEMRGAGASPLPMGPGREAPEKSQGMHAASPAWGRLGIEEDAVFPARLVEHVDPVLAAFLSRVVAGMQDAVVVPDGCPARLLLPDMAADGERPAARLVGVGELVAEVVGLAPALVVEDAVAVEQPADADHVEAAAELLVHEIEDSLVGVLDAASALATASVGVAVIVVTVGDLVGEVDVADVDPACRRVRCEPGVALALESDDLEVEALASVVGEGGADAAVAQFSARHGSRAFEVQDLLAFAGVWLVHGFPTFRVRIVWVNAATCPQGAAGRPGEGG